MFDFLKRENTTQTRQERKREKKEDILVVLEIRRKESGKGCWVWVNIEKASPFFIFLSLLSKSVYIIKAENTF